MEPKLDYFFHNIGDFPLPQAFAEAQYPWEVLEKADTIGREVPLWGFPPVETPPRDVCISGPCAIGRNTVIGPGTVIQGPAVIGEGCLIQPGFLIRPGTVIGNHCVIGHGCEIKHSIVASHAKLQSMSFVGDSLIGRSARVGSGVILANRRFDQAPIGATKTAFLLYSRRLRPAGRQLCHPTRYPDRTIYLGLSRHRTAGLHPGMQTGIPSQAPYHGRSPAPEAEGLSLWASILEPTASGEKPM